MTEKTFTQKRWSLSDLYPTADGPEMKKDFSAMDEKIAAFEQKRASLTETLSENEFLEIIHLLEEIYTIASKLGGYAELLFTEDTQSQTAMALMARVQQKLADVENHTLFFTLWWKDLPDSAAERLMKNSGDYCYWLEQLRHLKPHTLSEPEEKIINIKNVTGVSAMTTLYDAITNRYTFKVEIEGR